MCLDLDLEDAGGLFAREGADDLFVFVALDHLIVGCGEHCSPLCAIYLIAHDVLDKLLVCIDADQVVT